MSGWGKPRLQGGGKSVNLSIAVDGSSSTDSPCLFPPGLKEMVSLPTKVPTALRRTFGSLAVILGLVFPATAGELLPPERPIPEVIDYYVDQELRAAEIIPAPRASDANLVRRLTLDLAGRIPTVA